MKKIYEDIKNDIGSIGVNTILLMVVICLLLFTKLMLECL